MRGTPAQTVGTPAPRAIALFSTLVGDWEREERRLGHAPAEIKKAVRQLRAIGEALGWGTLAAVDKRKLEVWLGDRLKSNGGTWSVKTHNNALGRLRTFGEWCKGNGDWPENVFAAVRWAEGEEGEGARPLLADEVAALIRETRAHEDRQIAENGRGRPDRYRGRWVLYTVAPWSGHRWGEMQKATWGELVLEGPEPCLTLSARKAKNRKGGQSVALHPEAVEALTWWRARLVADGRPAGRGDRVFPTMPSRHTFEADMERAGIVKVDDAGGVASFHSLRKFLADHLDRQHVRDKTLQSQMRHSSLQITRQRYQRSTIAEAARIMASLPRLTQQHGGDGLSRESQDQTNAEKNLSTPLESTISLDKLMESDEKSDMTTGPTHPAHQRPAARGRAQKANGAGGNRTTVLQSPAYAARGSLDGLLSAFADLLHTARVIAGHEGAPDAR